MKKSYMNVSIVISQERIKKLEKILGNYRNVLGGSKVKKKVLEAFNFERQATYIKLYEVKTKSSVELIEQLEEFFFVGEVYFYPESQESELHGFVIVSRFKNLLDLAIKHVREYNGRLVRFPYLAAILFGTPFEEVALEYSQERLKALEKLLGKYLYIFEDGYAVPHILKAYSSEKPVTSIEFLDNAKPNIIKTLIKELEKFFFVGNNCSDLEMRGHGKEIFVSRYKNPLDVMVKHGVVEEFADLSGFLLLGKSSIEVAQYCLREEMKKYNLVK